MSENKVQAEMESSPVADFFASFFGQCWKEPSTEEDIKFEGVDRKQKSGEKSRDKKEKKAKKEKKDKEDKGEKQDQKVNAELAGASGVGASSSVAEGAMPFPKQPTTARYLIDNSILQNKKAPGISFRSRKCESDKVTCGPGPAKWGDVVEGTEEGDGWLKVGNMFLPMKYQDVPVITLVPGGDPAESPIQVPASVGQNAKAADEQHSEPSSQVSATAALEGDKVIKIKQIEAPEGAQVPEKADNVKAAAELVQKLETTAAWFAQPSVGTWLQPRPELLVQEKVLSVIEPEENQKCSFACEPVEKRVPSLVEDEPLAAMGVEHLCAFIIEPEKQHAPVSEPHRMDMCHLPSVGTWLLRPTPAVSDIDEDPACVEQEQKQKEIEFAQFTKTDYEPEGFVQGVMDLLQ